MRVVKPTAEILKQVTAFIQACELMLEREPFSMRDIYEKWEELPDDDEDKIRLLSMRKRIAADEDIEESQVDGRILAYEFLKDKYTNRLSHADLTLNVLLDNCCDPMDNCLEFHPSFEQRHVAPEQ